MRKGIVLLVLVAGLLLGCAPPFPQETLARVDRNITFRDLRKDPGRYTGRWVMLAGLIIASRNTKEGTTIEMLQRPAYDDGRPRDTDETGGRFLIQSEGYLETAVFRPGRLLTVVGVVAGETTQKLDDIEYRYPVVTAKALHLWSSGSEPRFFFGIGVSHSL